MKGVSFTKMHGLGNDFMVIEDLEAKLELDVNTVRAWSNRRTGIGFDQLLLVSAPSVDGAEFDYRIFNADGQEVEHCGNGARCFARFVSERNLTSSRRIAVNTQRGIITLQLLDDDQVCVCMGVPQYEPSRIPFVADTVAEHYKIDVQGKELEIGACSIGNPHAVLRVHDINTAEVALLGPLIESHSRFPNRVNVGFMQIIDRSHVKLRVFERGVGETLACGTGACAAAAVGRFQGLLDKTVSVTLPGGELKIHWPEMHAQIEMTGPCSTVFEGQTRM